MKYLIVVALLMLTYKAANATNLRGQVVHNVSGKYYPLANTRVNFMVWDNQQWVFRAYAITGNDGFYFFANFTPGLVFCIQVMGGYYPPAPLTVQNLPTNSYQDIPVISA